MSSHVTRGIWIILALFLTAGWVHASVGTVQFSAGDVKIRDAAGKLRDARKGDTINVGDTILTGVQASAQLKMSDGGILAVRQETELKITQYTYSGKEDGTENAFMSLLKGGFRTITGVIGRANKDNYKVSTPTATIGIRGTDHEPHFVPTVPLGAPQPSTPPGTYDKVNVGVAFIATPQGTLNIAQNQVGFAAPNQAPQLLPVMPDIFKATPPINQAQQEKEAEKEKQAAAEKEKQAAAPKPAAKPAAGTGGQSQESQGTPAAEKAADTPAASQAAAPSEVRSTAVVDNTSSPATSTTTAITATTATTTTTTPTITQTVTGTSSASNLGVNLTTQTLSTSTGASVPVSQGAFALQAQAAADAAAATVTALNTALTSAGAASGTSVQSAVSAATPGVTAAQTGVTAALALTVDVATATANAASAANVAAAAQTQANAAIAAFTANGTFADSTATAAKNALTTANNTLQTANTAVQGNLTTVSTRAGNLSAAQQSANTAMTTANTLLGQANTVLTTLTASSLQNSTASSLLSVAQSAATAAQTAATLALSLQNSGDITGAQAQATIAQQQAGLAANALANAAQIIVGVTSADAAVIAANAASGSVTTAQTEQTQGASAAASLVTGLATVNTNAPVVTANAAGTAFNNPAVASSNFTHAVHSQRPLSTSTTERAILDAFNNNPNTVYVLDGNKNLVEIRNTTYESYGVNYPAQALVTGANAKFSGGTAFDTYNIVDANGAFYMGRWAGGQIDITGPITRTDLLGPASAHWLIGLLPENAFAPYPVNVNNVQTLTGTANYTLLANTTPTDSFGNTGVLNSATLAANFTAQTVNAGVDVSFASRNLQITGSATNVPIGKDGFDAYTGGRYQPVVNCIGTGCATAAPSGYYGSIGGAFGGTQAGAVGPRAAMSYEFAPLVASPPLNTPYSDLINGFAVLSTAATPTPGVLSNFNGSANVRNEAMYSTQAFGGSAAGDIFFGSIRDTVSGLTTNPGFIYNGPRTSNNVMFDAAGNLARIFDTSYVIFDLATDVAATTTNFRVPTPLANAQVSFGASGSVAAEQYGYTPTGYTDPIIRLGRWQGGAINVLDTATGDAYLDPILGSAHWLVRQGVPSGGFAGVTGTYNYSRVAATAPTDNYGNVGTLEGARLAVDFNRMLVSLGLRIDMPGFGGSLLSARASEIPISSSGGFNVSTGNNISTNPSYPELLHISCTGAGCAPDQTYGGRVRGGFAGTDAAGTAGVIEGAYYRYTFNTNYPDTATAAANGRVNQEYVNGYVAFGRDPAAGVGSTLVTPASNPALFSVNGSTNPPGDAVILNAYAFTNDSNLPFSFTEMRTNSFDAAGSSSRWGAFPPGYAVDGSGNLTFASHFFEGDNERITIAGGASPVNFSAQGITHGYVYQPNLSGEDWNGPYTDRVPLAAFHWLRGPALYPWYAGEVMTHPGTTYVGYAQLVGLQGGLVTNQAGIPGSVTGTLQVNFNAQSVNTSINAVVSGGTFLANANGIALDEGGFFWASSGGAHRHTMGLTFNGSSASTWGNLNGLLMNTTPGAAPNDGILGGAGVAFAFQGPTDTATGTLVFGNPAYVTPPPDGSVFQPSALMDYRFLLVASGMTLADPANGVNQAPGSVTRDGIGGSLISEQDNYLVRATAVSSDRIQTISSTTAAPVNLQGALVKFDGYQNMIWNSCSPTPGSQCNSETQLPVRYALAYATGGGPTVDNGRTAATAVALETGYDAASGVRWGRWGGGVMNVGDRASTNGASAPPSGTAPSTIDLTKQNWHYLMTISQGSPVTIPTTGTATFTLVGGTSPTAYTPGQLSVDVGTLGSVSLAANFGTQQITMLQVNASTPGSGNWSASNIGNLPILQNSVFIAERSLDGTGNLAVTRNGSAVNTAGQIIGGFTNGAAAAGLAYSLNHGGPTGSTISGVAVMRKN